MATLFDEIQTRLRSSAPPPPTAPGGAQQAAMNAFQAKTGKAVAAGGTPAASAVGQNVAAAATQAAGAQQAARTTAAVEQAAAENTAQRTATTQSAEALAANQRSFDAQQQAAQAATAMGRQSNADVAKLQLESQASLTGQKVAHAASAAVTALAADRQVQADDIFEGYRQGTQELAFRQDASDLEQTAQKLALADKAYVANLEQVGQLRRLDNDLQYKEEVNRLTLGQQLDDVLKNASFQIDLNADQRDFNEQMSSMDVDFARSVLAADSSAANARLILSGGTQAGKTIVDAATKRSSNPDENVGLTPEETNSTYDYGVNISDLKEI